ncbi:MAG: S-layer homology domain-containing protein [Oscillospiraceae bacterium]|nr:S-layer homology domain-containing protein [Oscillospiraceae bacterium]
MKRILSLVLILSMLISMLPVIATAAEVKLEYKFNPNGKNGSTIYVRELIATETGKISWVEAGDGEDTSITNGPYKAYMHKWGICTNTTAAGRWLALEIEINEAGTYSASLLHGQTKSTGKGGYGDIYLFPGDKDTTNIASFLTDDNRIGEKVAYISTGSSDVAEKETDLSDVTVEEGEEGKHILVFYAKEKGYDSCQMYPNTLTLTKGQTGSGDDTGGEDDGNGDDDETPVEYCGYKAVYDFTQTANDGRDTTLLSTKNFWGFGGVNSGWTTDADSFKKRSYGLQVQKLAAGNWFALAINVPAPGTYKLSLGHITAAQGGVSRLYVMPEGADVNAGLTNPKYKLKNTVDFYSEEQSASTMETLLGNYTFEAAGEHLLVFTYAGNSPNYTGDKNRSAHYLSYLVLDGGKEALPMSISAELYEDVTVGTSAQTVVTALMSDESEKKIDASEFDFSVENDSVATVDESGYVTGVMEGTTKVFVEMKNKNASASFDVKVGKAGTLKSIFTYDFNEGLTNSDKLNSVTEYGQERGLWKYHDAKGASVANSQIHKWGAELRTGAENEWVALRIKVTRSARYFATLTHGKSNTSGGYGKVYILPGDVADIDAALSAAEPVGGEVAYYAEDNAEAATTELSGVDLTAGVYNLVFVASRQGLTGFRQYPGVLTLDAGNIFRFLDIETEEKTLKIYPDGTADKTKVEFEARLLDSTEIPEDELYVVYGTEDDSVAECTDGIITATGHGVTNVYVSVTHNGRTMTAKQEITVTDTSGIKDVTVSADGMNFAGEKVKLSATVLFNSGKSFKLSNSDVTYEIVGDAGEICDGEYVRLESAGTVLVRAGTNLTGDTVTGKPVEIVFREPTEKKASTYYTDERRAAARENIKKYDWARELADIAVKNGDDALQTYEYLYDHITGEGLPRSKQVGAEGDPDYIYCRYCGNDNAAEYGDRKGGAFDVDIYSRKWKIQCPDCKRLFPSNDFGLLYERGLDEHGYYDRDRAVKANAEAVARGEKDALFNELYPELYNPESELYNKDPRTGAKVDGKRWGVDDGLGYLPGRKYENDVEERHGYIAYYTHEVWKEVNRNLLNLGKAYLYTDDSRYGRALCVLVDRIADVFPSFSYKQWDNMYLIAHGGSGFGKIYGRINDCTYTTTFIQYADAAYPMRNDPEVIKFLSEKAKKYNLENTKTSGDKIWANIEDGLLRESFVAAKEGNISGNFGLQQRMLAAAALVLDTEPESSAIVDWIYQPGKWSEDRNNNTAKCTGGNLSVQLVNAVDRDGAGDESSPNYNSAWVENLYECADMLQMYSKDKKYDLYQNPKFAKMFTVYIPLVLSDSYTVQIGDSGAVASIDYMDDINMLTAGFRSLKDSPVGEELAAYIYKRNGNTADGLHYDIFTKDPERMKQEVLDRIGEGFVQESEMLTGYGFAVLRDGAKYADMGHITHYNNMRDYWIYFGRNQGHGHLDTLNLGIEAFGLNVAPDNGYPEVASTDPHRYQWMEATVAHNTVTVNEKSQVDIGPHGYPKHFDDAGEVKVMDIDASGAYTETDIYRRTLLMINAGDDVSYGVDFFRVKGGYDHIYSFHGLSDEIYETEGLGELKYQTDDGTENGEFVGSYAGKDVPYGPDPSNTHVAADFIYPRGYTWMKNIRRAENVGSFSVDFKITDFRKVLRDGKGLHLRMTMLNDFALDEVALTSGNVANKSENKGIPKTLEYVLARRKGENLDSLYTTVYEPYRNERYIAEMSALTITPAEGTPVGTDVAKAVKVLRTDGRVDYVMYATDNTVLYTVTDGERNISFRGFVGVYSVNAEGKVIYTYVHDGDVIGEEENLTSRISGVISDFTRELSLKNSIYVTTNDVVDADSLAGKYVFTENDGVQNGAYRICNAEKTDDGIRLDIGTVSPVRSYRNAEDTSLGFVYNIAKGQKISVPLSVVNDGAPVFDPVAKNITVSAGNSVSVKLNAACEDGSWVEYIAKSIPRGASVNAGNGNITWKPDASQIGENHFAVTARDENGRETTLHFTVTVYGSTTGKPSDNISDKTETPSTPAGGGGGGGGGAAPADKPENTTDNADKTDNADDSTESNADNGVSDVPNFIDLSDHAWATDAINTLAEDGIIKGTSASTFSPASNITRADFALLLVRAFRLTSDNAENFADVSAADYFASELAIARNNGIIGGIGENKFAPRNNITRQDMMVIVYRALQKLGVGLDACGEPQYPDFTTVAPYARDAASALIGAGFVNGKNGFIAPTEYTTRAEVAVLLYRILNSFDEK